MLRPSIDQQITFLHASDLEATAKFYEEILNLALVLDQGNCRIYQTTKDSFIGFCQHIPATEMPSGVILTLVTEEVDKWYNYLINKDVSFEKRPQQNQKYNIYHCFVRDPDGYLIEIQHFLDPDWSK